YVQLFNGTLLKMNLYEVESNILRMQYSHIDTLININLGGINEKLKKIGIEKSKERVLNYDCDILTVESDDLKDNPLRKASYYFNPEFPINSKWYEKQKASSYNVIYEKMEALPIKIIVAKKDLTITMIATSIHKQLIPDSVFIKRLTLY
ncbi:MAG TPA: hypothetical protein VK174_14225, partial [Chitinophagales bacterium]|nr:hypothetical protein [Chitinophagales bacterium]